MPFPEFTPIKEKRKRTETTKITYDPKTLQQLKKKFKKALKEIQESIFLTPEFPERFYPSDSEVIYVLDSESEQRATQILDEQ